VAIPAIAGEGSRHALAGAGLAAVEVVVIVVLHLVETQAGGEAQGLAGRQLAVQVGRQALEGDVVIVDAHGGTLRVLLVVDGAVGVAPAQQGDGVFFARTGAVVVVQADDQPGSPGLEVHPVLAEEAKGAVGGGVLAGVVAHRPAGNDVHAVVAQIGGERQQGLLVELVVEGAGQTPGFYLAGGEGDVVVARVGVVLRLVERADMRLVDL